MTQNLPVLATPKPPSFLKRAAQAARYTISGITPGGWMSPLQPLPPFQPVEQPWQWDRPVGYNIFYTPRGREQYSFADLRALAKNSEMVRMAIETRQDQMAAMEWMIKPRDDNETGDNDPRIKKISEFFAMPDKMHDWDQWLRIVLEELFVTDALSIAPRLDRSGGLYALELVDGSTIFPLVDQTGRQPLPPDPAYQQILKGVPKNDYTSEELIYYVRKAQVNTLYGYPVVEQILQSAETDIERIKYTLSFFTEGSVPDAYITAPDGMTVDQVKAYESHLNAILAGNREGRRQMPVLVPGMEIHSLKQAELKNDFDEWLARKVCFAFSLPPTAFVKQLNRNTSESAQDAAKDEGLFPLLLYIKRLMDRIIATYFDAADLEFHWDTDVERDPQVQATIDVELVKAGIMSINEVRDARGLDDIEGGDVPMLATGTGYVPIPGSALYDEQQQQKAEQAAEAHQNQLALMEAKKPAAGEGKVVDINEAVKLKKKFRYDKFQSRSIPHAP